MDTVLLEKADLFGGTTAVSGGWAWLPRSAIARGQGLKDSPEAVMSYLKHMTQGKVDKQLLSAFVDAAPDAVSFLHEQTQVRFCCPSHSPDYEREAPGGSAGGRALMCEPLDGRLLGEWISLLQPPLRELTFLGMMLGSGREVLHFFRASRSLRSAGFVLWRLARHAIDLVRHGRGMGLTNGTALSARLLLSLRDSEVPIHLGTSVDVLLRDNGRVSGVEALWRGQRKTIRARRGVILACGGFSRDEQRTNHFPHIGASDSHLALAPEGVTGDGLRLALTAGAQIADRHNAAAWVPVSKVPRSEGGIGVFPHFVDRAKPGVIAVTCSGRRFVNEATNYHAFVQAMVLAAGTARPVRAFLVCDARAIRRYGLGAVLPAPLPRGRWIRNGYLHEAPTLKSLALKLQMAPADLLATAAKFNHDAAQGLDSEFGRGSTEHNRYMGDAWVSPNPCLGTLDKPPFYALEVLVGDLGTFTGVLTDAGARAIGKDGRVIPGLYVAGNDMASCMGGSYPGAGATIGAALVFGWIAAHKLHTDAGPNAPA